MLPFRLCCFWATAFVAGVLTTRYYYAYHDILATKNHEDDPFNAALFLANSVTSSSPPILRSRTTPWTATTTASAVLPLPSLPVSKKRQETDGLSMAANRFKIPYPTIARAELLAFQVPLRPQEPGGGVKVVEYSEEAFQREILHGVPVLFKNFYKRPLIDPHHVRDTVGDMSIPVKTGNYGDPEYGRGDSHFHANTQYFTTMGKFIDTVIDGGQTDKGVIPYAGNIKCNRECEEKMMGRGNSIHFPFYKKMRPQAKFWVSKAGTLTPLHRDTADNLIVQLWGQKEWTLFPIRKDVADRLYYNPSPIQGVGSERSLVNITSPDLDKFPAFDGVLEEFSFKATVDAGDLLFLPVGWGHEVYTVTDSVMLNYWTSEPKSIYEHVCYTLGRDSSIMDLVYSPDNIEAQLPASTMLPVSGLKVTGNGRNGVQLSHHEPVGEQFTLIFDIQLPEGSSGRLVSKTRPEKVFWALELLDCHHLMFQYTAAVESENASSSVEWATRDSMCSDNSQIKHRIIVSVDGDRATLTVDQESFGEMELEGLIDDCESSKSSSLSSCTLQVAELQLPKGTVGKMPLAFVHREMAL